MVKEAKPKKEAVLAKDSVLGHEYLSEKGRDVLVLKKLVTGQIVARMRTLKKARVVDSVQKLLPADFVLLPK